MNFDNKIVPCLPGFEHIKRRYNTQENCVFANIFLGQFYVTNEREYLCTTLGSCVAACVRDVKMSIGGMNHFMLPNTDLNAGGLATDVLYRYGQYSMQALLNAFSHLGSDRENLEIKIFGGSSSNTSFKSIGMKNIDFIKKYLSDEGLSIALEDVGGSYSRRIIFYAHTGKVLVKKITL